MDLGTRRVLKNKFHSMKKISWFSLNNTDVSGELWASQGYANAALSTIKAIQGKHFGVFYNRPEIPFHINFCQPHYYQLNNDYKVGYTPWESTKIPNSWLYNMSLCNEIWATSTFVKEVYEQHNVNENIYVIPHGISDEFSIIERELNNTFNFLHIGGDSKRKNAQLVVDAFLELFDGKPEYRLILKYNNFCHAEVYLNGKLLPASQHPQIISFPNVFDTNQMIKLYHKSHCLVYPTSGEGFGMIPFESMATGLPTILTNATGCADFAHYGIPLEADFNLAEYNSHQYATDTGMWATPDLDDLIELMKNVTNEYEIFKRHAYRSAKIIHQDHSWSSVADMIIARYEEFEKKLI